MRTCSCIIIDPDQTDRGLLVENWVSQLQSLSEKQLDKKPEYIRWVGTYVSKTRLIAKCKQFFLVNNNLFCPNLTQRSL